MFAKLFEVVTGQPYWTGRSMGAEFGAPPAVRYAYPLVGLTDEQVAMSGDRIIADAVTNDPAEVGASR